MILQKPKVELGAHVEGQQLRVSFYPSSIMSQELQLSMIEAEKIKKLKDADDQKIHRAFSPRSCKNQPKMDKVPLSSRSFNLDLKSLNKSSAYQLKSQPRYIASVAADSRTSDDIINVVLQEKHPHIKMQIPEAFSGEESPLTNVSVQMQE